MKATHPLAPKRPACKTQDVQNRLAVEIYYEDTDALGVVYYANYLRYLHRAHRGARQDG